MNIKLRARKRFFISTLQNSGESWFKIGVLDKIDLNKKLDVLCKGKNINYLSFRKVDK